MAPRKKTPAPGHKVHYALVCDDIREEVSGKSILIGVYNEAIIVRQFPASFSKLFFRVTLTLYEAAKEATFILRSNDGKERVNSTIELGDAPLNTMLATNFLVRGIILQDEDVLTVLYGVDGPPKRVASVTVRKPITVEEESMRPS